MDIYEIFGKFELELLPQEWVQLVWRNDFSENIELPAEYEMHLENVSIGNLMNAASLYIKDWLATPENANVHSSMSSSNLEISKPSTSAASESTRMSMEFNNGDKKSWRCLIANRVQHKSLICLLSYFIQQGRLNVNDEDSRQLCLKATSLYYILLAIPGSVVFHVFHSILYSQAIEGLKMCNLLNSDSNSKQKSNRGRRGNQAASSDDEADDSEPEEDRQITAHERNTLIKSLNSVLNDILFSIKKFQLKGQEDCLVLTIQILVLITRLEKTSSNVLLNSPTHATITSLAHNAYIALKFLCSPEHGAVKETVRLIMRELLPGILIYEQKGTKLSTKEAQVIKDHSIQFVRNILLTLKEAAFLGVKALVQHLCIRIPDKADIRAKCVQVVLEVMDVLPYTLYSQVVVWIMSLCHNDQVKNRITGLEIVTRLLNHNERVPTSPILTVREVQQINRESMNIDEGLDINKEATLNKDVHKNGSADNEENANENENCDLGENIDKDVSAERNMNENSNADSNVDTSVHLQNFSSQKFLIGTVFSRTRDTSATVRAKSLSIISNLVTSNNRTVRTVMENIFITPFVGLRPDEVNNVNTNKFLDFQQFLTHVFEETSKDVDPLPGALTVIEQLENFAEDEKVFVRKSALQVLCNIFLLNDQWMSNRLLQVLVDNCRDLSVSVRKMLVQCLTELLIHYPTHSDLPKFWIVGVLPLLADQEIKSQEKVLEALQSVVVDNIVAYDRMRTPVHDLPWKLLPLISDLNMRRHLLFACHKWTLNNCIKQSLITTIRTHIGTENNISAWLLLASIAEYTDIKDPQFVLDYYYENIFNAQQVDGYCSQLVVEVLHLSWRKLPNSTQLDLCKDILKSLTQFIVPLQLIARSIDICHLITEAYADSTEESRERVKDWAGHLIQVAENHLHRLIGADSPSKVADEELLSQYIFTIGDASQICPNKIKHDTLLLLQNLLQVDGFSDKEEKRWKGTVSASVQAVAVITLGKICLQKDRIANTFVPLFGALLCETSYPQIKINAMIALADLCIRYTSMVEKHIPNMCICMRDKELVVRENTLSLMIQLIQEDYLKLRCPVFFHILTMLLDREKHIRDMVSSFLINSLLVKRKNIMVQHFVESLFHYNGYTDHPTHSKIVQSAKERATFSLEGVGKEKERRTIYGFLLEHMMDDQRLRISHQICTDILADVTEGTIKLDETGKSLLQDALYVLSCDEIRLSQMKPSAKDDDDDDGGGGGEMEEMAAEVFSKLAKKTVSEVIKKNFVENMVPIFIKLKHKLKQLKSVLVKDLMNCLRELLKDYKTEINEILAADKELAAEIQLDMQNSEENVSDEESGDEGGLHEEVLKQAVMEVVVRCKRLTAMDIAEAMNTSHRDVENENIENEMQPLSPQNLAPNPAEESAPLDLPGGSEQTAKSFKTREDVLADAHESSIVSKSKSAKSKESPPVNFQDSITSSESKDSKTKDSVSTPLTSSTSSKSSKSKDSSFTSSHETSTSSKSRSAKSRSDTSIKLHDSSASSKYSESPMSVSSTDSEKKRINKEKLTSSSSSSHKSEGSRRKTGKKKKK